MNVNKALFLDRDGVINVDYGYVHKIENFHFIDGIFDLCRAAVEKGYLIILVTNQAGIGRGYYSEQHFDALTEWMSGRFLQEGVAISKVYFSPYHPEHGVGDYKKKTDCRKPQPGMILTAAEEFDINLKSSLLVGDNHSDMKAAAAAGIPKAYLFQATAEKNSDSYSIDQTAVSSIKDLGEVIDYL